MIIIKQHKITREDIRSNPDVCYIFGDNLQRIGYGGQAKEMRGEANSVGIATKRGITHKFPDDYFFDGQPDVMGIIDEEFRRLIREIFQRKYKAVILPADGIGTGLARLPELAPNLLQYIMTWLQRIEQLPYSR